MNRRAIALLSGGLDSLLAAKMILDQDMDVVGLHFTSSFATEKGRVRSRQAEHSAAELGIRLIVRDKGAAFLDVLKRPRHGYGKNMNPCIDCRIFMLKIAADIMRDEGASFVVTGEVLGQRPMSQRRAAIGLIERESGLEGLIVRPLSARLFPRSLPESEGVVDRGELLALSGRSRKTQLALAASLGLREYGCPAGGCLLTDPIFAEKLRELLTQEPGAGEKDMELLRMGRHFRIGGRKLVLGRNREENDTLHDLQGEEDVLIQPFNFRGPAGLYRGTPDERTLDVIARLISYYGKHSSSPVVVEWSGRGTGRHEVEPGEIEVERYRIGRL